MGSLDSADSNIVVFTISWLIFLVQKYSMLEVLVVQYLDPFLFLSLSLSLFLSFSLSLSLS